MNKLWCSLCLSALMVLCIGYAAAEVTQLPGSSFSMDLPEVTESYTVAEVSRCTADWGFLQQDGTVLELQVYAFPGGGFSLEELTALEKEQNTADGYYSDIASVEIAGLPAICMRASEELWQCTGYILADGDNFVQLNFWYQGDHSLDVTLMMDTLTRNPNAESLGSADARSAAHAQEGNVSGRVAIADSGFRITLPAGTWSDPLTEEDLASDLYACWYIDTLEVQVFCYQSSDTLADTLRIINGDGSYDACTPLTLAETDALCYRKHMEEQDALYSCIGYLLQEGTMCVELVFWYPGEQTPDAAADMIASLSHT